MAERGLTRQSDLEELSAWMDGELTPEAAQRVARLVRSDPAWQATWEQFRRLEQAMGLLGPVSPPSDLTEPIVRAAHRRRRLVRAAEVFGPLAAAAGILLAVVLAWPGGKAPPTALGGTEAKIASVLKDVRAQDRPIVQNLGFFRNLQQVEEYEPVRDVVDGETLSALAALESGSRM